jgi:putative ABC transport system permease protein
MTRHLLALVWNRKRRNGLLALEIFLSFLVLFGVTFLTLQYYWHWRQPIGFEVEPVWGIELRYPYTGPLRPDANGGETAEARRRARETLDRVRAALDDLPGIEASAASWPSMLYVGGGWSSVIGDPGVFTAVHVVSDEFLDVLGLRLVAGRWFSREDDGGATQAAVLNVRLAGQLFGDSDPLGRELPPVGGPGARPLRVVGVIEDFRHEGELEPPRNVTILRLHDGDTPAVLPNALMARVAPGTSARFEETILEALQPVAPDWSFGVQPATSRRENAFRKTAAPLIVVAVLAAFLLLMVALGLSGVLWQSVTMRIQEFGLRRAKGATARAIQRQVVVELLLLTTLAVGVAVALVAQIPALPLGETEFGALPPAPVWMASIAVSAGVIYLLTLLCAWYPSRLATRILPADALHYE